MTIKNSNIGCYYLYILNLFNLPEAYRIRKKVQSLNIDIIHSNSSVINFGAYLSKALGIPHVWHFREYGEEFGARVFKITRDEQGNRLTHMKVTGGMLKSKAVLEGISQKYQEWMEQLLL